MFFNDIFGNVLWKCLIEDEPPDPGEIQETRKGNFPIEYLIFFSNIVLSLHRYIQREKIE